MNEHTTRTGRLLTHFFLIAVTVATLYPLLLVLLVQKS